MDVVRGFYGRRINDETLGNFFHYKDLLFDHIIKLSARRIFQKVDNFGGGGLIISQWNVAEYKHTPKIKYTVFASKR